MYLAKQIPDNTDSLVSRLILTSVILRNLAFKIELYLAKQIPDNTDRVVSGLILTSVLLKFGDGDGPNLCRVKKVYVSSTFIENIFRSGMTLVTSSYCF